MLIFFFKYICRLLKWVSTSKILLTGISRSCILFLVETPLETKLRPETKIYVTCSVKNINIDLPHFHENFLVFLCKNQKFKNLESLFYFHWYQCTLELYSTTALKIIKIHFFNNTYCRFKVKVSIHGILISGRIQRETS